MTVAGHDDFADRDRIRTEVRTNLFVEAGAGTGKTRELVHRVVELVVSGTLEDIRGLAAITFTEKAAGELRDRIRRALESAAAGGDSTRAGRARQALEDLDDAAIGTLHGFAMRILSEHPIQAGLPPGFELVDPVVAAVDFDERWSRFVDELFASEPFQPVLRRAFAMKLRLENLREVAVELHQHWDRLCPGAPAESPELGRVDLSSVTEALAECLAAAEACDAGDKLAGRIIEDIPPYLTRVRIAADACDEPSLITLLVEDAPGLAPGQSGGRNQTVDQLRAAMRAADGVLAETAADLRRGVLVPIVDRLGRFTLEGASRRHRDGQLELADLLVHAARVLSEDDEVRAQLGRRWPVVLVDEFQDTDPLQIHIAALLTLDDPTEAPELWEHARCGPGRLFVVGDPKQSIYRFRRADIALYDSAKGLFGPGSVQLTQNFRTVPAVIEWINEVFSRVFAEGIPHRQPGYRALVAARQPVGGAPAPVVVLGGPRDDAPLSEIREAEAAQIAETVAGLVDSGEPVSQKNSPDRPARHDDIAILLPTRTSLSEIERALDARGVPFRVESRSLVFGSDEVRELVTILRAVDHPGDAVALVGALRTPAFGCSDRDLAEYRWAKGQWSVRLPTPDDLDPSNPVPAAMSVIAAYHDMRQWLPVNELVERIIRERALVELTVARPRPRDHWRRYRLLADEARAFVAGGGSNLGEFISWVDHQAEEGATRLESIVPEPDDRAVRILTIHAAKGLEFPIAVLAGLNVQVRPRQSRVLWPSGAAGPPQVRVGVSSAPFETAGYREAADLEAGMDQLERHRLLYVAATRARDKLVVSLHHKAGTDSHASMLWDQMNDLWHLVQHMPGPAPANATPADVPHADVPHADVPHADVPDADVHGAVEAGQVGQGSVLASVEMADRLGRWQADRDRLLARAGAGAVRAPSRIASTMTEEEPISRPGQRGRAGSAIGRAVHAVLQVLDLAHPTDLEAIAQVQAGMENIPGHAATVAMLARSAVESETVREAVQGRYWRELFVVAPAGDTGTLIEGYIDLLYETPRGEIVVVDYKTDQARTEADLDARVEHYRLQAAAYVVAVERALERPVSRCVLVFARPGGAIERPLADLDQARAEVLASLSAV